MPYFFTVDAKYDTGKYILYNPSDLMNNFPFLEGKVVIGKFLSTYRDGRTRRINKEFKCKLSQSEYTVIGEILEPNPLKAIGLPLPSPLLIIVYKYEEESGQEMVEYPIAENVMVRGGVYSYFEDDIKIIFKEEEAGLILEGTVFPFTIRKICFNFKRSSFVI